MREAAEAMDSRIAGLVKNRAKRGFLWWKGVSFRHIQVTEVTSSKLVVASSGMFLAVVRSLIGYPADNCRM